jgi:hypothetical protein
MTNCKPKSIPADLNVRLEPNKIERETDVQYRETVGALLHLTVNTRPDIAFAVNQKRPEQAHWNAVKRILAYLAGTINY